MSKVLNKLPQMFGMAVTKQVPKRCGLNRHLSRHVGVVINICPNCGQENELLKHATRCKAPKMKEIFRDLVNIMLPWMPKTPM